MTDRISADEVKKVARLARLAASEDEIEQFRSQLNAILGHMASLDGLDVADVPPTYHALESGAGLRVDERGRPLLRDEVLRAAPSVDGPGFAVPAVLEAD